MRVLVTGSRDLTDADMVHDALSNLFEHMDDDEVLTVVHGGARGADRFAGAWARLMRRYGVKEEVHEADWHTHTDACPDWDRGRPVCKLAGGRRNQEMVLSKPDRVLAFYKGGAKNIGTRDCVNRARLARISIIEYTQLSD